MARFSLHSALVVLSIVATCVLSHPPHGEDKTTLRFKIFGRDLPDKDTLTTIDPYITLYYTENEGTSETKFGRSSTKSNTRNPDWDDTYTFQFDRSKRQRWHIVVKDHDLLRRDEKAGQVWVSVADYVDAGQYLQVNLVKKGYLIIKRV